MMMVTCHNYIVTVYYSCMGCKPTHRGHHIVDEWWTLIPGVAKLGYHLIRNSSLFWGWCTSTRASLILSRVDTCRHYWTWRLVLMHGKQACNHTIWGLQSVPKKTNPLEDDFSVNMSKVGFQPCPKGCLSHTVSEGIWRRVIPFP